MRHRLVGTCFRVDSKKPCEVYSVVDGIAHTDNGYITIELLRKYTDKLSPDQVRLMGEMAQGKPVRDIAKQRGVKEQGLYTLARRAKEKLGVSSIEEALKICRLEGLFE